MLYYGKYQNILSSLPDKSIDLILTDPPYLHKKGHTLKDYANTKSVFANSALYRFDGEMMKEWNFFDKEQIYELLELCKRVMKKMNAYFFCSEAQVVHYLSWAEENRYHSTILVWEKPLSIISKNRFSQNAEFIIRVYEHGTGLNKLDNSQLYSRIRKCSPVAHKNKLHPTQKPYELIEGILLLNSDKGEIVLDPFMGSGVTGVVAQNNSRNFIGAEVNPKYFEIASNSINEINLALWTL